MISIIFTFIGQFSDNPVHIWKCLHSLLHWFLCYFLPLICHLTVDRLSETEFWGELWICFRGKLGSSGLKWLRTRHCRFKLFWKSSKLFSADHFCLCSGERTVDPSIRARWAVPAAAGWHWQGKADSHTNRCQPLSRGCHVPLWRLLWLYTVHWSVSECTGKTLYLLLLGCRK